MSENIARNMYSSQGIINYTTQLHLVGYSRILYHDARKHEYQVGSRSSTNKDVHSFVFLNSRWTPLDGISLLAAALLIAELNTTRCRTSQW